MKAETPSSSVPPETASRSPFSVTQQRGLNQGCADQLFLHLWLLTDAIVCLVASCIVCLSFVLQLW
jgi:hypothetical protein